MHGKIAQLLNLPLPRLLALPYGWVYLLVLFILAPVALRLHLFFVDLRWYTPDNEWLFVVFGAPCILSYVLYYFVLGLCFKNYYHRRNWTLRKELYNMLSFFVTALLTNALFLHYVMPGHPDDHTFALFVWHITITYNLMPVVCFTAIKNGYYFARKRQSPKLEEPEPPQVAVEEGVLDLQPYKGKLYKHNDLAFFYVDGNYTEVHAYENNELRKVQLQISLVTIQNQLTGYAQFVRCHNSFLVNTDKIERSIGPKRQRRLKISGSKTEVKVAYERADAVDAALKIRQR